MSLTPFFSANGISVGNLFNPTNVVLANGSITAGNTVSANYFVGNGALLTGIVAGTSYSNANVAAYLPNYQGEISNIDFRSTSPAAVALVSNSRPLTIGGNILSYITIPNDANANVVAAELTNHGLGNVLISSGPDDHEWVFDYTGNLRLPGNTWSVYYANGVQVPLGGAGNYSNANVAAYLASNSNITITTTGNITGNYIAGNGIAVTTVAATPPANPEQGDIWIRSDTGVQYIYFTSGGNSQWAEMEALQSFSNGSSIVGGYGNTDVASYLASNSAVVISTTGNITTAGNVTGTYILGNGSFLTGLTAGYGNSNVAAYLNSGTAGNILPSANVTYDLGSNSYRWNDLYLANSTIYLGSVEVSETSGNLVLPANVMIGSQPITSSGGNLALPAGTTIGGTLAQAPKISNVQIATASWVVKDDTAISPDGGYIVINGSGFVAGASVLINTSPAASVNVVNANTIRAQVNAASVGTYVVYVINPDGSVAILVNGLTYSTTPTWVTGSSLPDQPANVPINIQLSATGATTYTISSGNTLPTGLTLSSSGLLSGLISVSSLTLYSFSVDAIDTELQESPRTFSLYITITDPYFNYVSLLIPGNGTNGANNSVFLDSSTNNFTVTRGGDTIQSTWTPYTPAGWSNYFDGTGDYLSMTGNVAFDFGAPSGNTNDFTLECWVYIAGNSTANPDGNRDASLFNIVVSGQFVLTWQIGGNAATTGTYISLYSGTNGAGALSFTSSAINQNTWNHLAITRSGTSFRLFINGTQAGSTITNSASWGSNSGAGAVRIGRLSDSTYIDDLNGYISNFRIVKGTAVYTSNFTPPTTALTAISGTSLLTCQSNAFKDNSTNNFSIAANGNAIITNWSPFLPTASWSAAIYGGSGYFDGSGDYLTVPDSAAFDFGSNNFTIEYWVYPTSQPATVYLVGQTNSGGYAPVLIYFNSGRPGAAVSPDGTSWTINGYTTNAITLNAWTHLALVRNGNKWSIYVNGVENIIAASTSVTPYNSSDALTIGLQTAGTLNFPYSGYISDLRIVKGTAVYTGNFTPPTTALTAISGTSLLLNFTNAGIYDAAEHGVITPVGTYISTAQSKFGGSSMYFNGFSYGSVRNSNLLNLTTGDFTIEGWFYCTALSGSGAQTILNKDGVRNQSFSQYAVAVTSAGKFVVTLGNGNGTNPTSTGYDGVTSVSLHTWHHFAVVRTGTTIKVFFDGTQTVSQAQGTAMSDGGKPLIIGYEWDQGLFAYFQGYIQTIRITKGIARYTGSFTIPTEAFPTK